MGGSTFDAGAYVSRQQTRAATGASAFVHTAAIQSGKAAAGCHATMNPHNIIREARDSTAHPESVPIAVFFDVTGSMGNIPITLQKKLGKLQEAIVGQAYLDHPQIMMGSTGDAYSDVAPLQVGQFESGIEQDDELGKLYLEGNGGGNGGESYALAHYFVTNYTSTDAWEKRGKKGYLFTIGDEPVHNLTKAELVQIFGANAEAGMTVKEAIELAQEKWEVFHILVQPQDRATRQWKDLLGERALVLDNPEAVCELIATTIGILEGRLSPDGVVTALTKAGFDTKSAASASRAVATLTPGASTALAKAVAVGDLDFGSVGGVKRN